MMSGLLKSSHELHVEGNESKFFKLGLFMFFMHRYIYFFIAVVQLCQTVFCFYHIGVLVIAMRNILYRRELYVVNEREK